MSTQISWLVNETLKLRHASRRQCLENATHRNGQALNLGRSCQKVFGSRPPALIRITCEIFTNLTRSHPEMVGDMSHVTLNSDLSKIPFVRLYWGSRPILTTKIKHVHLLVLIWEWLQTPTTTVTTTTTTDTTVQPLGRHIANEKVVLLE